MMMETFCVGFLLRRTEYEHLHVIIDTYRSRYELIDTASMFYDEDSFNERFPAICRTLIKLRGDGQSYVLALLGFAFHTHTLLCRDPSADWYGLGIMVETLIDVLTCINFKPDDYYCKPRTYCIIL